MLTWMILVLYCLAIVAASVLGGLVPVLAQLRHKTLQLLLSAVSGFMLGVALLHLLPHAAEMAPIESVCVVLLVGLLTMFFIERFFAFHDHEPGHHSDHQHGSESCSHTHGGDSDSDSDSGGGGEGIGAGAGQDGVAGSNLTWTGATIGMSLHSLIGGLALGAAVVAETKVAADGTHLHQVSWPGLSVFLVTLLHKPLDALTVMTLVSQSNMPRKQGHLINTLFALAVPLGALLTMVGLGAVLKDHPAWIGYALAFSAGTFLCIALSDVLPELHFHTHDRMPLTAALIVGVLMAVGVGYFEHQGHAHEMDHLHHSEQAAEQTQVTDDHPDHHGHAHE